MDELSNVLVKGFTRYFRDSAKRVQALSENLNEEEFWKNPYPYGNSFGHITLHITGNLNHFIGKHIIETDYVRLRNLEFTERHLQTKEVILIRLDETIGLVTAALEGQTNESWSEEY
jgi:hypothetical protein